MSFAASWQAAAASRPLGLVRRSQRGRLQDGSRLMTSCSAGTSGLAPSFKDSEYAKEVAVSLKAVRSAAFLTTGVQKGLKQSQETSQKADDSPVTVADYAAQAVVSWYLRSAFPDVPLVAEEDSKSLREESGKVMRARVTELVNSALARDSAGPLTEAQVMDCIDHGSSQGGRKGTELSQQRKYFVLDPIDGTKGFVKAAQYAVALGMLVDGQVVLGLLGCPNIPQSGFPLDAGVEVGLSQEGGSLLVAAQGCGAFQVPLKAEGMDGAQKVSVDTARAPNQGRYMESQKHSIAAAFGQTAKLAEFMGIKEAPIRLDSQAKYALLARGDADIYLRFPPADYNEKIWDHAPGAAIITEAGGCISDARGEPLDFGSGRTLNIHGGIIAGPPKIHQELVRGVKELGYVRP